MVGVGIEGLESSLARVSLVNYYGAIILDEFVRQRERVVDYRTHVSGIRETDMIKGKSVTEINFFNFNFVTYENTAKPFSEIQTKVAELLKDRILVGHAVHNDLKVDGLSLLSRLSSLLLPGIVTFTSPTSNA